MATEIVKAPTGECTVRTTPPLKTGLVVYYRPARKKPRKYSLQDGVRIVRYIKCEHTDKEIICAVLRELDGGRLLLDAVVRILGADVAGTPDTPGGTTAQAGSMAAKAGTVATIVRWLTIAKDVRSLIQTLQSLIDRIKSSWLWRLFGKSIIVRLIVNTIQGALGILGAMLALLDEIEAIITLLTNLYCEDTKDDR